jgi:hypothetical protein
MGYYGNAKGVFITEYTVPPEKKPLLQTGAVFIYSNDASGWTPQTLRINPSLIPPIEILASFWNVHNKEDAKKLVNSFIETGGSWESDGSNLESRKQLDERLSQYAHGGKETFTASESQMLEDVIDMINGYKWEKMIINKGDLDKVTTTLAWDLERAAFIARMAYNCDYFSEEETWDILKRTRDLAESNFDDWLGYGISFMKGAAIVMNEADFLAVSDMWENVYLLAEPKWGEVWTWFPLKQ